MTNQAALVFAIIKAVQAIILTLQDNFTPTADQCPTSSPIDTINSISSFDYVIVGGGDAGSIIANRMSETDAKILLIEEGGCPPMEAFLPGLFPLLPGSKYDRFMSFENDHYACQNQKPEGGATTGKMLGGSGALHHLLHVIPSPEDFTSGAEATNDQSWGFDNMIKYIAKSENVTDEQEKIPAFHGDSGPLTMTKVECSLLTDVIDAHQEMGIAFKNDSEGISLTKPWVTIGGGERQCGASSYLKGLKDRPNLYVLTSAVATKIIFDGTTATGVQFTFGNSIYNATATKKVIVTAGTFKTPQLLMLSGIGDKDALNKLGIPLVVHNSEVGQNLRDHVGALFLVTLNNSTEVAETPSPRQFPAHVVINHGGFNCQCKKERQDIILYFKPKSDGLIQLCTNAFKYKDPICNAWYENNINRNVLLIASNLMHPLSTGSVTPNTTNINDQPIIKLGLLSNPADLDKFGLLLFQYFKKLLNTKALKNRGAELVEVGVCGEHKKLSLDFWKCYLLAMSTTYWHYMGTCAMGKVVDGLLNVKGTTGLVVADASVIPYPPTGKLGTYVRALGERAADIIKKVDGWDV